MCFKHNVWKEFYKVITGNPPFEINTSVRPLYITLTKHNYVPFTLITGGKIISNENWIGNLMIQGDLIISKNTKINISNGSPVIEGSLTIEDGVKLNFDKDLQLIVKGNLIASGINSNVISFKSINEKNKWGGIVFDPLANGILENCEIQNAITGINCKKTLPKICNNSLYKNNTAINVFDINNLDNSISCNNIFANKQKGIYVNNSFIKIERNNIYENDVGIDCFHSNVFYIKIY
ncbi:MAG: right-handed parallel beta-helix repeat-containing protein [Ignavibacteriae bacterium]|nr:right-handed parallel beta-helix repeat-containing protein [Ignavibacteriota bacterium]